MGLISIQTKKAYLLHKMDNGKVCLCKVLDEFWDEDEAAEVLIKLLTHKISEKQVLKEYAKKGI